MTIKLGSKAKDPITGFEGVVVCRSEYLNGCARISLQAPMDKDGKVPDWQSFDEIQLESKPSTTSTGGPRPDPVGPQDPNK